MTVRDSITRTRARTPGVEDDPTSATVRDRALGPTQCGISDVATKCTKGGRKPNICRCMLGAVLSWRCLGRHRLRCQPCSRIGENPPYGMIGGIEETSASSKPDPRLDPTRLRGALSNERPYRDLRNVVANYPLERPRRFPGFQPSSGHREHSRLSCGAGDTHPSLVLRMIDDPFRAWRMPCGKRIDFSEATGAFSGNLYARRP